VTLREHEHARALRVCHLGEGRFEVEGAGAEPVGLRVVSWGEDRVVVEHDGVRRALWWASTDEGLALDEDGRAFTFAEPSREHAEQAEGGDGLVRAPIGGRVTEVRVAPGDAVERGEALLVVEAMKMEHRVPAPRGGRVVRIAVTAGDQVTARQIVAELSADGATEDA
ncbi:MAG: hypothetical protein KDK70_37540, partial [Myxococcales bacterium]|nr:hypothetical protein [Myxococcales bacterium]